MKTLYKKLLVLVLAVFSFTACNTDDLDIKQQGALTLDEYQTADDSEVEQFIAAVYAEIHGDAYQAVMAGGPACWLAFRSEMSRMSGESANYYAYNESADAGTYSYIYSYFYRTAYWCSMIVEHLPGNEVATPALVNQVVAEARALRAISMMYLVQLYGNPPLADHIINGTEGNTPAAESWAWIEQELKDAAEQLPTKSGLGGQSVIGGRITREAAYAYLGKAQLWQKKYNEAAATLHNLVIATGKYQLYDNYADYNSSVSDFSDENLWEFDFNEDPASASGQEGCFDITVYSPGVSVWFHTYASPFMAFGTSAYVAAPFEEFLKTHDGEESSRYKATILEVCNASTMGMLSTPINECEGFIKVKDMCLADDLAGDFPYLYTRRNLVYMRYAEVLLNYAEAVAMGGADGNKVSGLEALNMVRRRALLKDAPLLDMNDATYGIKAERRAELYGEGHRFIDLVRWGDAAEELKDCGKVSYTCNLTNGMEVAAGVVMYFGKEILTTNTGGNGFKSGKNELFPLPSSDVNSNPNLTQNPGW